MKCVNTDWDQELIKRLKRGRSTGRRTPKSDRPASCGDRTVSSVPTPGAGRWTMEQRLAQRAAKEAEKRAMTQMAEANLNRSSTPPSSEKTRLFESPFWKIRMEIMESKNRDLGSQKSMDNQGFRKKMKILDDRASEMKKILTPPRRPHQELPPVKRTTNAVEPKPKFVEVTSITERPKSAKLCNLEDVLQQRPVKREPNFIDFSSMSSEVWADICGLEHGESIPIMMKSMRTQLWEKFIKYYGVFERAGRLDRGVLYELAADLGDKLLEHPTYKEVLSNLDEDPNEGLFLLGKIMMNIYHVIALQATNSGRSLSIQEVSSKLDHGYKTMMKSKKEEDVRSSMRTNMKGQK